MSKAADTQSDVTSRFLSRTKARTQNAVGDIVAPVPAPDVVPTLTRVADRTPAVRALDAEPRVEGVDSARTQAEGPAPDPVAVEASGERAQRRAVDVIPPATSDSNAPRAAKAPSAKVSKAKVPTNAAASNLPPDMGLAGRLEERESVRRLTLDLPQALVDALLHFESRENARLNQRIYRERYIDAALGAIPEDIEKLLERAGELRGLFRAGESEQIGTRVRETVHQRTQRLRHQLRLSRVRGVFLRDLYAVAIYEYLDALGADLSMIAPEAEQWPPS